MEREREGGKGEREWEGKNKRESRRSNKKKIEGSGGSTRTAMR